MDIVEASIWWTSAQINWKILYFVWDIAVLVSALSATFQICTFRGHFVTLISQEKHTHCTWKLPCRSMTLWRCVDKEIWVWIVKPDWAVRLKVNMWKLPIFHMFGQALSQHRLMVDIWNSTHNQGPVSSLLGSNFRFSHACSRLGRFR
jgi:hypothetical protein